MPANIATASAPVKAAAEFLTPIRTVALAEEAAFDGWIDAHAAELAAVSEDDAAVDLGH